ncbi:MAG TPA: hypothetical protein VLX85_00425 [Stellaceae bacterium]|nr:hypothetical protein [Stellaceae bacterium]
MVAALPAKADWLERAWSDDSVATNGAPAVTLAANGGVLVVLPEATLREAYAAGLDTKTAVSLFLGRWGQRCSDVLDLEQEKKNIKVELFLQRPVALEDVPKAVQGEILSTLLALKKEAAKGAPKSAKTPPPPPVESVFVVSETHVDFVIDYVPHGKASCRRPGSEGDAVS